MPEFSHLPLILKPNGKGKLSKRDGDQLGFPVFPMQWFDKEKNETASGYKEAGYFPQAFINMLALLGWNAGTEQEIFTMEELIAAFSLEKVGKSGSKFDPEKTKWFNQQYMRLQSNETLANMLSEMPEVQKFNKTPDFLAKVCNLVKERAVFVKDIWEQGSYFFQAPTVFDDKTIKKQWKENTPEIMTELKNILLNEENFEAHYLEEIVKNWVEQKQYGFGKVMNPLRLILVGGSFGVHIFDIITMIGKEETIRRIDFALNTIKL
jgi:glutamyl-tRNA synthetase